MQLEQRREAKRLERMRDRVWLSSGMRRVAPALAALTAVACNPDPGGTCTSDTQCLYNLHCNQADHLCEACATPCYVGTVCSGGVCAPPFAPTVLLPDVSSDPILSRTDDVVQVTSTLTVLR